MRKISKWMALVVAVILCMTAFVACNPESTTQSYSVTYYDSDGTTVLKTEKVDAGQKAQNWTPTKEGFNFVNWYATPGYTHLFSFDDAINENKSVFAQWQSAQQSVDTRTYYIVGSGTSPVLSTSSWGTVVNDDMKMTKSATENQYTYTVDIFRGDFFQFAINGDWHNQRGFGYLTVLTLDDNTEVFSGSGTIGENSSLRQNIKCELAGNYTFTLTTHPDDDTYETEHPSYTEANKEAFNINPLDSIVWVRNGDVSTEVDVVTDFYIKGAGITSWKDMYNADTKMSNTDGVYTLSIYLKGGEEFMFTSRNTINGAVSVGAEYLRASNLDEESKTYIDQNASFNMIAKESGTYTFTYTAATSVLSAAFDATVVPAAADYYIDGTFDTVAADWSGYCFNEKFKLQAASPAGVYEIKNVAMKADSQIIIQAFKEGATERGEWGTDSYNGLGSYNYTYLYNGGAAFSAVSAENQNIKVVTAGTYDITFDSYAKIITITEHIESADTLDIYIKGEGINEWNHNFSEDWRFALSADEENYEFELTVVEGTPVSFGLAKYTKGATSGYGDYIGADAIGTTGTANALFTPTTGSNFACSTAGTYRILYNIETGKVDFSTVNP